ncbi:hypothetical protein [Thermodesulfatator indicus]
MNKYIFYSVFIILLFLFSELAYAGIQILSAEKIYVKLNAVLRNNAIKVKCKEKDQFEKEKEYLNRIDLCIKDLEKEAEKSTFYVEPESNTYRKIYDPEKEVLIIDITFPKMRRLRLSKYDLLFPVPLCKKTESIYVLKLQEVSDMIGNDLINKEYFLLPVEDLINNRFVFKIDIAPDLAKKVFDDIVLIYKFQPGVLKMCPLLKNKDREISYLYQRYAHYTFDYSLDEESWYEYFIGAQNIELIVYNKKTQAILLSKEITKKQKSKPIKSNKLKRQNKNSFKYDTKFCSLIRQYCYEAGYEGGKDDKKRGLPCNASDYYNLPLVKSFLEIIKMKETFAKFLENSLSHAKMNQKLKEFG